MGRKQTSGERKSYSGRKEHGWKQQFEGIQCISGSLFNRCQFLSDQNGKMLIMSMQKMLEEEVLTSRRDPAIPGCIRINVGNRAENEKIN